MKILFGLLGVAAVAYVVSLVVVRSERIRTEEGKPASWPLGDARMRGFAREFRNN